MKLTVSDKNKKDLFVSIFYLVKSCTSIVRIMFKSDKLYIQGMDKAHICLFEITLISTWFNEYEPLEKDEIVSLDSHIFHNILSMSQDKHAISLLYEKDSDKFNIDFITSSDAKNDFNKFFNIPLIDLDSVLLDIPEVEYDAEFSINAKQICEVMSQLLVFGDIINIQCNEDKIAIYTHGVSGEMHVNIPIDDLSEYSLGDNMDISYSLTYLSKMCMTTKLSPEIAFGVSSECPMKIKYDLGDGSCVLFFIAPKIE